jgi:hypothetical protein
MPTELDPGHTVLTKGNERGKTVGRSRIRKIKSVNIQSQQQDLYDVFYMSPDEARRALEQKYEFLAERYEQKFPKHKGIAT